MKRTYEAVVALNTRGTEESVEKLISSVGRDIEAEGAKLQQIDQLGRKKLAYTPNKESEAFYVAYHFESEPANIDKLRARLKLNHDVFYQYYQVQA